LLEQYKNRSSGLVPTSEDYLRIREAAQGLQHHKMHISDYCLHDLDTDEYFLIELKIGGDLDNKKARSEKEALFEQYAILSNSLPQSAVIHCKFATAYNRYGE
jgi:hypothetical protein